MARRSDPGNPSAIQLVLILWVDLKMAKTVMMTLKSHENVQFSNLSKELSLMKCVAIAGAAPLNIVAETKLTLWCLCGEGWGGDIPLPTSSIPLQYGNEGKTISCVLCRFVCRSPAMLQCLMCVGCHTFALQILGPIWFEMCKLVSSQACNTH